MKYCIIFLSLFPMICSAQQNKQLKNELQLTVALDSYYAFEFEPSYSYMFHKNIGLTGGFKGVVEVVDNLHYDLVGSPEYQWRIYDKKKVSSLLFRLGLRLKYELINDFIFIVSEPAVLFNIIPNESLEFAYVNTQKIDFAHPRYMKAKNTGGDILSYSLKNYLSFSFDIFTIMIGYDLSTYDVYSSRRNIVVEGDALNKHLPAKTKLTHSGFIGIGYSF